MKIKKTVNTPVNRPSSSKAQKLNLLVIFGFTIFMGIIVTNIKNPYLAFFIGIVALIGSYLLVERFPPFAMIKAKRPKKITLGMTDEQFKERFN